MSNITTPSMQDMLEAGVHFGHKVSRGNPRMKQFIFGARDGIHIIDLALSEEYLKQATEYAYKLGAEGKVLLVVGTKKQSREVVSTLAKQANTPFINFHWVGGILTNFDEVRRNINKLIGLRDEQKAGTLSRYTKKEQLLIGRKVEKFEQVLGGVATMDKMPDAMFILDIVADQTAVKEGLRMGVPMIGVSDTNSNPDQVDFAIPSNDDGIKAIKLTADTIMNAYIAGKKAAGIETGKETDTSKVIASEAKQSDETEVEAPVIDSPVLADEAAVIEEAIEKEVVAEAK